MLQCELRSDPCAAGREGRWVSPPHRLHVKVSEAMSSTVTPSLSDGISPTGRRIDDRSLRCNPLSHNKEWFFLSSQWTWQTYWAVTGRASSLPQSLHTLSFNFWKRVWRTWIKARICLKHLHELRDQRECLSVRCSAVHPGCRGLLLWATTGLYLCFLWSCSTNLNTYLCLSSAASAQFHARLIFPEVKYCAGDVQQFSWESFETSA